MCMNKTFELIKFYNNGFNYFFRRIETWILRLHITTLRYKMNFLFNPTEKVINAIIIELNKFQCEKISA